MKNKTLLLLIFTCFFSITIAQTPQSEVRRREFPTPLMIEKLSLSQSQIDSFKNAYSAKNTEMNLLREDNSKTEKQFHKLAAKINLNFEKKLKSYLNKAQIKNYKEFYKPQRKENQKRRCCFLRK